MLLAEIVQTSQRVAATGSRLERTGCLTDLLRRLPAGESRIAVAYLTGRLPRGRIGVGPALVTEVMRPEPAARPSLSLVQVDQALAQIATLGGAGSAAERRRLLSRLCEGATGEEQAFLGRLLLGELRQGALEGIMAEAIAKAAGVPPSGVRRAVMLTGDLARVSEAVFSEGYAGLGRFRIQLMRPLKPMLARAADDLSDALRELGSATLEFKLDGATKA